MKAELPITCPCCSLLCTDIRFTVDRGRLTDFTPECALGRAGFDRSLSAASAEGVDSPPAAGALETAREWLRKARQPLIVLSGSADCASVSTAVRLAQHHSAILTFDEELTGSTFSLSMQAAGILTATLGDLRGLDLAVLCGVDPGGTHPRLADFLNMDLETNALRLDPADPLETIRWLRLATAGGQNLPVELNEAVSRIAAAKSGLVIFGKSWLERGQPFTTEVLLWVKDLNKTGRWYALYLAPAPNSSGVVETLLSETGYPGSLRFGPHGASYSQHLWRAERLIERGAVDACLLVGQPEGLSETALAHLSGMRSILLSPSSPGRTPSLWLPSAQTGVDSPGAYMRMDGVPIELNSILPSQRRPLNDLLLELLQE